MKDFQEHIDEPNTTQSENSWEDSKTRQPFLQQIGKLLWRYSLLIIVGIAALSITFLRFQGQSVWDSLRATPLPQFFLEEEITLKELPDKTEVYDQALAEESRKRRPHGKDKITKPNWLGHSAPDTVVKSPDTLRLVQDTVISKPKRTITRKKRGNLLPTAKPVNAVPDKVNLSDSSVTLTITSFFQPVRANSPTIDQGFIRCVVDGDQEVKSNDRIRLRLEEPLTLNERTVPAHTLVYGEVRLTQNRLQITIPRIGPQLVSLAVYDHTYHPGLLLHEHLEVVREATQTTAYRQGNRSLSVLPNVASELGRNLLQHSRRSSPTVFLPDGFPLFIHP
uniref:Conjugative transposon protein TraM n=1 Tax=Roseihalotalea indica TaxID=2867963 RepID=A0AA49GPM7_9BACT|nr:conjugative transposon protein TraM [Tunicatimonas sp. TK19036]